MAVAEKGRSPSEAKGPQVEDAPYPPENYAWYVVIILMIVYIFSFIDRQILSLLVGPIKADLDITDSQMSYLMGFSFALFYTIFGIPMGRLADSASRRGIIAVGLTVWSFMSAGCGIAKNYWQLLAFRVGVGVGEATLSPSAYSMITDYFRPQRMALAISVYGAGIYIGSGMAFLLGAIVVQFATERGPVDIAIIGTVRPWQLVFFLIGLPGVLFAFALFTVREPLRRGLGKAGAAHQAVPVSEVKSYVVQNWRTFLCHNVGFAMLSFIGYGAAAWIPEFYIRTHGWERGDTGKLYGMAVIIFGTAGIIYGGQLSGWLAEGGYKRSRGRWTPAIAILLGMAIIWPLTLTNWVSIPNPTLLIGIYVGLFALFFVYDRLLCVLLDKTATTDSKMRAGFYAAAAHLPFGLAFPLVGDSTLAFGIMCLSAFAIAMPFGVAPAAIQEMMPNRMRGQASAIYLFVVNLIGLGLGPSATAWCTDYIFKDTSMIRYSMALTGTIAGVVSVVLLSIGLGQFRRSLALRDAWGAASESK
ncbi:MAG: MFS transporter [Candidatus Hydrogenedentota bacterium]